MKLSFITPTAYTEKFANKGDFHLALSHLCDEKCNNEYATKLKESGLPIYLDNGTYENGLPEEVVVLMRKAILLKAEHVFAPDYLYNHEATSAALRRMVDLKKQLNVDIKIAAVVQASHFTTWLDFYQELVRNPGVDLIGLSILSIPQAFKQLTKSRDVTINRIRAIKEINKLSCQKDSHLLGLGDSLEDVMYAKEVAPWIKSHDSSSAYVCGKEGKLYSNDSFRIPGGKSIHRVDFDEDILTLEQEKNILTNINYLTKHLYDS